MSCVQMNPHVPDNNQEPRINTQILLFVTRHLYLKCNKSTRYLSTLIKVAVINDTPDRLPEMTSKADIRASGPSLPVTRKYTRVIMYSGCVTVPTNKSVNERANNKVLDGECRDLVRQIERRMTAFPKLAINRPIALTTQLASKQVLNLATVFVLLSQWCKMKFSIVICRWNWRSCLCRHQHTHSLSREWIKA